MPRPEKRLCSLAAFAATVWLAVGCGLLPDSVEIPTIRPDPLYEELYPYYVELCALDQYRKLDGHVGAFPGHAVLYLKGACRREDAPYPALEPCGEPIADPNHPRHGAGISVNRMFRNVNWVATPGKALFLDGELAPEDRLDPARYEAAIDRARTLGLYRGVEIHDAWRSETPNGQPLDAFLSRSGVGTDYALRFARTLFCTRMPITASMLERAIAFLNALNDQYASGAADYRWSGYHDNCVHTIHNALAAASVWRPKAVWQIKALQLFHLAIPANAFIELAARGHETEIEPWWRLWLDEPAREALLRHAWLPNRDGVLIKVLAIHPHNALFDTRHRLFVLEGPLRRAQTRRLARMLEDPRYTDLTANLLHFERRYAKLLEEHPTELDRGGPDGLAPHWRRHIERELAGVRARLEALCDAERAGRCARAAAADSP